MKNKNYNRTILEKIINRLNFYFITYFELIKTVVNIWFCVDGIILNTPIHGNLGDHAITIATKQWLVDNFSCLRIIEISGIGYSKFQSFYKKLIRKNERINILFVNGGGYLGDLWIEEENRVLDYVNTFSEKKVVILPQTIYYDVDSQEGIDLCYRAKSIYEKHNDLILCARERESYFFMKKYFFNCNIILVPDMVTIMSIEGHRRIRKNIILCFRKDKEKILTDLEQENIKECVQNLFSNEKIVYTDTVLKRYIGVINRKSIVNRKLREFAGAKLIITDRLHGMIFAVITGTPCIVLESKSCKIRGVYEWICKNEYVVLMQTSSDLCNILRNMDLEREYVYSNETCKTSFRELEKYLGRR